MYCRPYVDVRQKYDPLYMSIAPHKCIKQLVAHVPKYADLCGVEFERLFLDAESVISDMHGVYSAGIIFRFCFCAFS